MDKLGELFVQLCYYYNTHRSIYNYIKDEAEDPNNLFIPFYQFLDIHWYLCLSQCKFFFFIKFRLNNSQCIAVTYL